MRRILLHSLAGAVLLIALAPPLQAIAGSKRLDPGEDPFITERGGDSGNLPIGCRYTPAEIVAWARTMPAVGEAIAEFERRGYLAHPSADQGVVGCSPHYTSMAFLAYEKPGVFLDSTRAVMPLIVVVSRLVTSIGEPETRVSAGLVYMDAGTSTMVMADSLEAFRMSDPSFDVEDVGGEGEPDPGIVRNGPFQINPSNQAKVGRFLNCTGQGGMSCVSGAAVGIAATGGIAALGALTPQGLGAIVVGCLSFAALTCGTQSFF